MEFIVDTNILFSTLLGGKTSRVFAKTVRKASLHTVSALVEEIRRHKDKIAKYSTLSIDTIETLIDEILREDLTLHDTAEIPGEVKEKARELTRNVDPDDWPFIALAMHLKIPLWTGDKDVIRLAVETRFKHYKAVDTRGVEILLEGKSWSEVEEYLLERYGEGPG